MASLRVSIKHKRLDNSNCGSALAEILHVHVRVECVMSVGPGCSLGVISQVDNFNTLSP